MITFKTNIILSFAAAALIVTLAMAPSLTSASKNADASSKFALSIIDGISCNAAEPD